MLQFQDTYTPEAVRNQDWSTEITPPQSRPAMRGVNPGASQQPRTGMMTGTAAQPPKLEDMGNDLPVEVITSPTSVQEAYRGSWKAVLSRTMPKASESGDRFVFGKLSIDTASHTVHVAGKEVALTPKEFDLLVYLATNKGLALSREKILQNVWHYDYFVEDRTVDTHVKMLRSHLGECRGYITTVWGIGYKFDPNAEAE